MAATLVACSGGGAHLVPPAGLTAPETAESWLQPDASALLYVSDPSGGDVAFYSYPYGKLVGRITNFYHAGGMCVSKSGNVFIAAQDGEQVRMYAHGGTKIMRTLTDPGYYPLGCAIDPVTGDLAVTSYTGTKNHGSLAIYSQAMGSPKVHFDVNIPHMLYCGYDSAGNLFLDGSTSKGAVLVGELAKGGTTIHTIPLDQTIAHGGGVQWDGTYLAVGDVSASVIYRFKIASGKGTKAGSVPLSGSTFVQEFWIAGSRVIAPDYASGKVRFYKYPAGGSATKIIAGFTGPQAATVSE